jgi:hypothetical protein
MEREKIIALENEANGTVFNHEADSITEAIGIEDTQFIEKALDAAMEKEGCTSETIEIFQQLLTKKETAFLCATLLNKYSEVKMQLMAISMMNMTSTDSESLPN